jgi:hypothetical protein
MLLEAPSSFKRPDGVYEHHIRQSDINRFRMCPDLHRAELWGEVEDFESDAAIVGTAAHLAYNAVLGAAGEGWDLGIGDAMQTAVTALQGLWGGPRFMQAKFSSLDEATAALATCLELFYNEALPWILTNYTITSLEKQFDVLIYKDGKREIYISGTWDVGAEQGLIDFKNSASDKYSASKKWELDRYDIQSTMYCWAEDMMALALEEGATKKTTDFANDSLLQPFHFVNMNWKKRKVEVLEIQNRTVADCKFLLVEINRLVELIESNLLRWPLGPDGWHCSPIWCPRWNDCRGKVLGPDPWKTLERRQTELGLTNVE